MVSELRLDKAYLIAADRISIYLRIPYDFNSHQDFIWPLKQASSTAHLKHEEVEPTDGGNGRLTSLPIRKRTEQDQLNTPPNQSEDELNHSNGEVVVLSYENFKVIIA